MKLLSGIIAASAAGAMAAGTPGCARPVKPHRPLRIALYSQPLGFDPHRESEMLTASVGSHLYEGLTRLDSRLRLQPALADRWETSDNLNWRFHVRSGVRFHDGQELRAEDVVFSIERARDLPQSTVASYVGNVSKVAALDDSTVEISLDRPLALLAYKLSFVMIVQRGALEDGTRPAGTGPYRLLTGSAELITLRAFERYWQGPPSEAEVELVVVPPSEPVSPVADLDIVQGLSWQTARETAGRTALRLVSGPSVATDYLSLRTDRGPFSDVRVRRAVSLALDRQALVAQMAGGRGRPANQLVGPSVVGHDPSLPALERDLGEAKRLLKSAGHAGGLDVELVFREGRSAGALVEQLAQAGIRARPEPRAWGEALKRLRSGQAALYYGGLVAGTGDASDLFESKLYSRTVGGWGDENSSAYTNPALDRLIESCAGTADPDQRLEIFAQATRLAMAELPLVPLFHADRLFLVRPGVVWRPRLDGSVLAQEVRRN